MEFKDYYKILGIAPNATENEIKKAYHHKVKLYHPDVYDNKDIPQSQKDYYKEEMEKVTEAYEILSNPELKIKYDFEYDDYYNQFKTTNEEDSMGNYNTYQEEMPKKKYKKHNSFASNLKKAYQDVKKEENKNNIVKRHRRINHELEAAFKGKRNTYAKEALFFLESGRVHAFYEIFYQLGKLKLKREDNFVRYSVRNRLLFLLILCFVIITNVLGNNKEEKAMNQDNYAQNDENESIYNSKYVTLKRNYKVGIGETLSQLAYDSGNSASDIKQMNGLNGDLLYWGAEMKVPYKIEREDLQYYILSVPTNNISIYDLAEKYETDIETLCKLNEGAIIVDSNSYTILTDTILVPNFISKEDLDKIKDCKITSAQK